VTALTVEDLSFTRGAEEVRVAWGKGNKERLVPMGPRLRRSLRHYLKARDALVAAGGPRGEGTESPSPPFRHREGLARHGGDPTEAALLLGQ
jgi:integrase